MRRSIKIEELGRIITGSTPPTNKSEYFGKDYLFIKPSDINKESRITYNTETKISEAGAEVFKTISIPKGSTCVVCIGSIGEKLTYTNCLVFTNQQINSIIPNVHFDNKYVFYLIKNNLYKLKAANQGSSSGRENVSKRTFGNIVVEIEDSIVHQKKISSILSAYDDLIENNQKQIKLLEEAAQRLYKEWFVDLRFPGHENVKIVDGVPEGWSKVQLQEFIDFDIGGGWGEEAQSATSEIPAYVIRGTDFEDIINGNFTLLPFRYHKKSNYESRKLQEGDIVFEVSGGSKNEGVARTLLVSKELLSSLNDSVICASFCKLVRPKKGFSQYLFDTFKFMRYAHITEQYDKRSASSIVNYRWQDFIVQELISVPDSITLSKYTSLLENISQAIMSRVREITLAKEARDRLLPKLMSGEIEV